MIDDDDTSWYKRKTTNEMGHLNFLADTVFPALWCFGGQQLDSELLWCGYDEVGELAYLGINKRHNSPLANYNVSK